MWPGMRGFGQHGELRALGQAHHLAGDPRPGRAERRRPRLPAQRERAGPRRPAHQRGRARRAVPRRQQCAGAHGVRLGGRHGGSGARPRRAPRHAGGRRGGCGACGTPRSSTPSW